MIRPWLAAALLLITLAAPQDGWGDGHPVGTASGVPPTEAPVVVPPDAAARLYLAQALASLARAEQLAHLASQYGAVGTFDIELFLAELRIVSGGLQQLLVPTAPVPGPHVPVEITGQYLYDGLSRRPQPSPLRKE